jgi:SAM-dependent methyltransferase
MYMKASGLWDRLPGLRILHAAPERRLSPLIAALAPVRHLRCDLSPSDAGIERVDLQAIPEADASFDLVIANHVLEHVADVEAVLAEIGRVLVPGGHAILQTPFALAIPETIEEAAVQSEKDRLERYGQEDHVRLFGSDIFARFESGLGGAMVGGSHAELLPGVDPRRAGVNAGEPFMLFRKAVGSAQAP